MLLILIVFLIGPILLEGIRALKEGEVFPREKEKPEKKRSSKDIVLDKDDYEEV